MTIGCERRQLSGLSLTICGCFAGLMLVAGCNSAPPPVDTKAAEDAVRAADAAQLKAAQAQDVAGVAGYYTANAVVMPPNAPIATDTVSIQKVWAALLVPGTELTWASTNVVSSASGEMVYDQGTYTANTKGPDGKPLIDQGKYLSLWMKQTDGSWKVAEDTWNSDLPIATAVPAPSMRRR